MPKMIWKENYLKQAVVSGHVLVICDESFYPDTNTTSATLWVIEETILSSSMSGLIPTVGPSSI